MIRNIKIDSLSSQGGPADSQSRDGFWCTVEGCDRTKPYLSRQSLKRHQDKAHGGRGFSCPFEKCEAGRIVIWHTRTGFTKHLAKVHPEVVDREEFAVANYSASHPPTAARSLNDSEASADRVNKRKQALSIGTIHEDSQGGRPPKRTLPIATSTPEEDQDAQVAELTARVEHLQEQLQKQAEQSRANVAGLTAQIQVLEMLLNRDEEERKDVDGR